MGDGGVTLAPPQHVMESVFSLNCFNSEMKTRKGDSCPDKGRSLEDKPRGKELERQRKSESESNSELEKVEFVTEKWRNGGEVELGEFVPEKPARRHEVESRSKKGGRGLKSELEKDEIVLAKGEQNLGRWGKWEKQEKVKGDPGRGVPSSDRWGKWESEKKGGDLGKREHSLDHWGNWEVEMKGRKGEKLDSYGPGRGRKMELEKGEFVPENNSRYRNKVEAERRVVEGDRVDPYGSVRGRRMKLGKVESIPENSYCRKDGGRESETDHPKRLSLSSSWDFKKSSRASEDEPGEFKYESSNGKTRDKDYYPESLPKRHCGESESGAQKYPQEFSNSSRLKNRRNSEEPPQASSNEKSYGNPPILSSKIPSSSILANSRQQEPLLLSRGSVDKQGQRDHRDRTPVHSDRSPPERTQHHRDQTPSHSHRSPVERARHHDHGDNHDRDRTRSHSDRSPMGRTRHHDRHHDHRDHPDYRDRTPSHSDRSPMERARHLDYKEWSPHDRGRAVDIRERNKNSGGGKNQHRHEERPGRRQSNARDGFKSSSLRQPNNISSATCTEKNGADDKPIKKTESPDSVKELTQLTPPLPTPPPPPPPSLPSSPIPPQPETNDVTDELPSMEEDMDICDTPPHETISVDPKPGKWLYLDHFGLEQGPSKLDDLKMLVDQGVLLSDHLIKHSDTDRWVTVENAASPLVQLNLPSIVSDAVTEMASPPEAPGNLLVDAGDLSIDSSTPVLQELDTVNEPAALEYSQKFLIDERVEALLNGYYVVDGKELEILGEVLNTTFEHAEWENWSRSEGFTRFQARATEPVHPREGVVRSHEGFPREAIDSRPLAPFEKDYAILNTSSSDWFSGRWSCMGGDWKRNDESCQDRSARKKIVLNHGYQLCQMPKSGHEDPRCYWKDDLYYPSRPKKLELPAWAFSMSEENSHVDNDNDAGKVMINRQMKPPIPKGLKGTVLPIVRINACVVSDHGSEPRSKFKGSDQHSQRSRSHSASGERNSYSEVSSHSKKTQEVDLQSLHRCRTVLNIPRDHVCTVDELSLDLGDWYYLDGAGHEHGPSAYSELQNLASKGVIMQNSSAFRKFDNIWLPVTALETSSSVKEGEDPIGQSSSTANKANISTFESFHCSHPQFIGYTRGKLHELVMKSYKTREFAAAINEVLDPWISEKQQKKETRSSVGHRSDDAAPFKRARLRLDGSDGDSEVEDNLYLGPKDAPFDDLCGEAAFVDENVTSSEPASKSWGLLNGHILARVFHFMKTDLKSIISSAATCKRWNLAVKFYKNICTHVDLSSVGSRCTDSMFQSVMGGHDNKKLTFIALTGCSNISAAVLEELLPLFPCISIIDIRGCSQFKDLVFKFQNIKWIKSPCNSKSYWESCSKIKSLKQLAESGFSASKAFRDFGGHLDDFEGQGDFVHNEFNLVDRKDSSSHPFRQGVYKRAKVFDARKSSSALSRDAQMRRWLHRKSENGYRKMEEFIAFNLKDIMKENRFEFFIPKVARIEDRMRSGYYVRHGLVSVKDDISRMCGDAFKAKNRGDAKDMKHVIMLFIRLAKRLEGNMRLLKYDRDDMSKIPKDGSEYSSASRYKKKQIKVTSEKKGSNRSSSISYSNGTDSFDREIKRGLSKLKKRDMDSDNETSDDHGNDFSEEDRSEGDTSASDTETDEELLSGSGIGNVKGNGYSMVDDTLDSVTDDREWGARMTKTSLVPPVTRKYEVIDKYLVIADEEEVKRKMRVALPDDYSEKLLAQKSGLEESDMEIPEVKEYKPRKMLGVEVVEQEVYGIDPYTHNLILDSMPEESDWLLVDKHKFIEEVLLRSLNKKARHFTGTGNTPVVCLLRPTVEEIQKNAEDDGDKRTLKLCQTILKAMQRRPDDNYVAYRKGLGVVCNKEGGFGEDDFVVEFLGEVYPGWKWFEKQDGIRSLQKNNQDPAPEFYNIYLERPKGDRDGYDLVVVDAMHKANYASRICHSCRPNCEAKVTAVDGQYQIGIYAVRPIGYGEEITFDYNSVTESKEEYEASVCLCGSQICRGSYLNLTGEGAFLKVLKECHGVLERHKLLLEACEANFVSEEDYIDLGRAGLGTCLLAGLPDWLVAYSAHLVRFMNFERTKLPEAILKHNLEEKKKFFADINLEDEKGDAEIQAEGVYNARLQNMALTLDKVRYVMRRLFGDPKKAPPPVEKLSSEALISVLWKGEGSFVEELLQSMLPHVEASLLSDLKSKIHAHDPSGSDNLQRELRKSLLWLRDELRDLPCTSKCRHDAAADLIHMYAFTKCFYKVREYKTVTSPPVYISPLDLGPKYVDKNGSGFEEYCKTYGENYCLGQLIYWYSQTNADPDCRLARASRGCLSLPDVSSFYGKSHKPVHERVYDTRTLRFMLSRMEQQPQRPWPTDRIWVFKNNPRFIGSPMLDVILNKSALDKEMIQWLKMRSAVYQSTWDG